MSATQAAKSYNQLSAEQRGLIDAKHIQASHTPEEWVQLLAEVASFDQSGDAQRKKIGWGCGISVVFTIILAIAFIPLAPVPFIAVIVLLVIYLRMKKHDVPNQLRESVLPLVALLREDLDPAEPLELSVDLRAGNRDSTKVRSRDLSGTGYPKVVETFYDNGWLSGRGVLVDGASVEWSVTDHIRERKVTKRNPRGKIKTKHKYKVRRLIDMRVGLRRDSYAVNAEAGASGLKTSLKEGEKRNVFKLRRQIVVAGVPNPHLEPGAVIDTLAGAYRRVNLVREEGKA